MERPNATSGAWHTACVIVTSQQEEAGMTDDTLRHDFA
jgi:hypothetical protein